MRRNKVISVFGAMALTVASTAGCTGSNEKATTAAVETTAAVTTAAATKPAETKPTEVEAPTEATTPEVTTAEESTEATQAVDAVTKDDDIIKDIYAESMALLAEEKYYSTVKDTVKIRVTVDDKKGSVSVDGFDGTGDDFIAELARAVPYFSAEEDSEVAFSSDAYDGSTTEIEFQWNPTLYSWQNMLRNNAKGSQFYSKAFDPTVKPPKKTEKTDIRVYAYTRDVPNLIQKYIDTHPEFARDYTVNYTIVTTDNGAYQSALDQALADYDYAPDLYVAEAAFVKKYTTGSASKYACTYEDLGINVEQKIRECEIAQYTADITRRDGKVVALGYQAYGCAFIYNREVAKAVFGDDRPETVEAALGSDWDSFFEAAEKCKQKGYAIVSGDGDIWRSVENSADHAWVVDGKLYIDPKREAFLDYSKRLKDNDYHNDTQDWMEGWYADMGGYGPKQVLGFYGPMWFLNYTLRDNCGSEIINDDGSVEYTGTFGQWGVCKPNVGAFWGGTWLIANKKVLEDEDLKAGVRELIEYVTLDTSETGAQYELANAKFYDEDRWDYSFPETVASLKVLRESDGRMSLLGGQDAFPVFIEANQLPRGDNLTEYDEWINTYWRDAVRAYTSGEYSRSEAIEWFKETIRYNIPYITVE